VLVSDSEDNTNSDDENNSNEGKSGKSSESEEDIDMQEQLMVKLIKKVALCKHELNFLFIFFFKYQSELFWGFKSEIDKHLTTKQVIKLLEHNKQYVGKPGQVKPHVVIKKINWKPTSITLQSLINFSLFFKLVDLLADCMCFGALNKCTKCKIGQYALRSDGYYCLYRTAWSACGNSLQKPPRRQASP
jgi:hypothetical protein